jgi:hypothetical protein
VLFHRFERFVVGYEACFKRKYGNSLLHPYLHLLATEGVVDRLSFPSKGWAEMIRKVREVDPMICLRCGGR